MSATLPDLRWSGFRGDSMFIEVLVRRITTPRLEKLDLDFFKDATVSIPSLFQVMNTLELLKFDSAQAKFEFLKGWVHHSRTSE
jgi:replication initiation and membrane attachment protein DnaB